MRMGNALYIITFERSSDKIWALNFGCKELYLLHLLLKRTDTSQPVWLVDTVLFNIINII